MSSIHAGRTAELCYECSSYAHDFPHFEISSNRIVRMYGGFEACSDSRYKAAGFLSVLVTLLACHLWQQAVCATSLLPDGAALLSIKASIENDPRGFLSDWKEGSEPCSWRGVRCDALGRVITLNLTGEGFNTRSSVPTKSCSSIRSCRNLSVCGERGWVSNSSAMLTGTLSPAVGNLSELRALLLPFNGFYGEIPEAISGLRFLEVIMLQGNKFSGSLPVGLGRLAELRTLNVALNSLQGPIPGEIAACRKLEILDMSGNKLSGGLPAFFDGLAGLQVVAMGCNRFSGMIPVELTRNCGSLLHVHLENNYLSGSIPVGFGRCSHLRSLLVSSNALSGQIPADLGHLQELQVLDVSQNSLGGDIPGQLANCSRLSVLVLTNSNDVSMCEESPSGTISEDESSSYQKGEFNHFSSIPMTALMRFSALKLLWAPAAAMGGSLSSEWGSCESLEVLNLASNSITGGIPEWLAKCRRLVYLDLSNNMLEGSLPVTLSVHCMVLFNVSGNFLTGQLPDRSSSISCSKSLLLESLFPTASGNVRGDDVSFVTRTMSSYFPTLYCGSALSRLPAWFSTLSMTVLHDMSNNNFTGPLRGVGIGDILLEKIPWYGFYVSGNNLTGGLPSSLFKLCQRVGALSLRLSRNRLSGELPADAMVQCASLVQFDAAANELVGNIPEGLGKLKHLVYLDLSFNSLSGKLPQDVGQLQDLQYFMLAANNITSTIPESFGKLRSLLVLDLSGNTLTGSIPGNLANLMHLKKILLNNNQLSGFIPKGFSRFKSLSLMDVTYNDLSEPVPQLRSLGTSCSTVKINGNELLTSCALSVPPPSNLASEEPLPDTSHLMKKTHDLNSVVIAAIVAGCAVVAVLIILVVLFLFTRRERHVRVSHRAERRSVVMFRSFEVGLTYENIVAATGNFSVDNLIGHGGFGATYKAELIPGVLVAVKRLSLGRIQGTQQFEAELRTLRRVQHPNLVTLLGFYASASEMFLLYNYLPGGNLESLIHDSRKGFVSWRVRHKIAFNVAQALAYLHDECIPRILHRDIKPSNVLLDNDLNAFLSDFGLARLLSASETHATTDVEGTFGYVAPEYAMTCRLSEKADVYSYGVVLLELLSGKKALDPYFSNYGNGFNIVAWAGLHYKRGKPAEILAPGLWEEGPHSELMEVLKLAVRCTVVTLSVRPTMREVVDVLKAVR